MKSKWLGDLSKPEQLPCPTSVERLGTFKNILWMRWELVRLTWDGREPLVTHMPEDHIRQLESRAYPQVQARSAVI